MYIYMIENNINGKKYIGQTTTSVEERFGRHCRKGSQVIQKAIQKYGKENFSVHLLYTASNLDDLNQAEVEFIKFYNTTRKGYNCTIGGVKTRMTPETIKKISNSNKGKVRSAEYRNKLSQIQKERYKNGIHHFIGRILSKTSTEKMSYSLKAWHKMNLNSNSRQVYSTLTKKIYSTIQAAAKDHGYKRESFYTFLSKGLNHKKRFSLYYIYN